MFLEKFPYRVKFYTKGEWRLEIGEWEDLPLAVGLYSRKRS